MPCYAELTLLAEDLYQKKKTYFGVINLIFLFPKALLLKELSYLV